MTTSETVAIAVMAFGLGALGAIVAIAWLAGDLLNGKDKK